MTRAKTTLPNGIAFNVEIEPREYVGLIGSDFELGYPGRLAEDVAREILVAFGASGVMAKRYAPAFIEDVLEAVPDVGGVLRADAIGKWMIHHTVKAVVDRKEREKTTV